MLGLVLAHHVSSADNEMLPFKKKSEVMRRLSKRGERSTADINGS
jgi:hypothetical protein